MSDLDASSRKKIVLAVVLIVLAITIGFLFHSPAEVNTEEVEKGLAGRQEEMVCMACKESFTMPADEYMRQMGMRSNEGKGLKCQKCGADAAWGEGLVNPYFDPESIKGIDMGTRVSVEAALVAATQELENMKADLARAESAGDEARVAELTKAVNRQDAKREYLDKMWAKRANEEASH